MKADDDDFDLVDDILDNLTAEKDPEPPAYQRPKTAGVAAAKESLWSAGGQNQRAGSGSRFKAEDDLDGLDEDEDAIGSALN